MQNKQGIISVIVVIIAIFVLISTHHIRLGSFTAAKPNSSTNVITPVPSGSNK
ncbi:hypothetical protein [Alicyclobacillus fodiniaquatilis]|jgi:hypothetical protein|uniref:Uncharacterized protein n=1 Tax=Alicyclobacillus fodiniaquatilis TaxID=1661150 RepID=A0ABW4JMK8_9BACL